MNIRKRLSELHRNLVVSYVEGERLGHVTNIYFDKPTCRIKGVSLAPGLIKGDQEKFVNFEAIHRLGTNVVIISTQKELTDLPPDIEASSLRALKGTKVVTQDGERLGELLDVNVFEKNGIISEIVLYGPRELKIDVKKDNVSIGPDMIIVPAYYRKRIAEIEPSDQERFIKNAGKTTRNVTESIKSAVLSVTAKKWSQEKPVKSNGKQASAENDSSKPILDSKAKPASKPATKKTMTATKKRLARRPARKVKTKKAAV